MLASNGIHQIEAWKVTKVSGVSKKFLKAWVNDNSMEWCNSHEKVATNKEHLDNNQQWQSSSDKGIYKMKLNAIECWIKKNAKVHGKDMKWKSIGFQGKSCNYHFGTVFMIYWEVVEHEWYWRHQKIEGVKTHKLWAIVDGVRQ